VRVTPIGWGVTLEPVFESTRREVPKFDGPRVGRRYHEVGLPGWARLVSTMKARVYVSLKPTVLDPQGQTIQSALNGLGHSLVGQVRQGKYFEIDLRPGSAREQAASEMELIAREVLANPVMEDYRVEIVDS